MKFNKTRSVNFDANFDGTQSSFGTWTYFLGLIRSQCFGTIDVLNKQQSQVTGKRILVHLPSILCRTLHSINDAKDERTPKVNVPEQSSQSISISSNNSYPPLKLFHARFPYLGEKNWNNKKYQWNRISTKRGMISVLGEIFDSDSWDVYPPSYFRFIAFLSKQII